MIKELEEYLEKRGAKYFVTMLMVFYVVGTIIFNIYLRSLGIYDFEFLQLRYMFSGAVFGLISAAILAIPFFLKKLFTKPKTEGEEDSKRKYQEIILLIFFVFWTPTYAIYIFPQIPPGFGGAKPTLARFVGNVQDIQDINEIIEYETSAEDLPLEVLNEKSSLAVGANVKILDRNAKRIWIILTKDLYLRSKSNLAKNLLDSGEDVESFEGEQEFKEKPLFVDAKAVKSISFSLYEPPEILTEEDLSVAAYVLADDSKTDEETTTIVKEIIQKESPEKADKIFKAVEKLSKPTTSQVVQKEQVSQIKEILEEELDSEFLNFRADVFKECLRLIDSEKFKGIQKEARKALVQKIETEMDENYKQPIPETNFLFTGIYDDDFPRKISHVFQGAGNAEEIKNRLLEQKRSAEIKKATKEKQQFESILSGALNLLQKSSASSSLENKKSISQVLIDYFASKAPREKKYWLESKYLSQGVADENFLDNLKIILKNSDSWESLEKSFGHFQEILEKNNPSTEEEEPFSGSGSVVE